MKNTKSHPIGELKTKKTVYCEICGETHIRRSRNILSIMIFNKTDIENKKLELTKRISKPYTCKICKSIQK